MYQLRRCMWKVGAFQAERWNTKHIIITNITVPAKEIIIALINPLYQKPLQLLPYKRERIMPLKIIQSNLSIYHLAYSRTDLNVFSFSNLETMSISNNQSGNYPLAFVFKENIHVHVNIFSQKKKAIKYFLFNRSEGNVP